MTRSPCACVCVFENGCNKSTGTTVEKPKSLSIARSLSLARIVPADDAIENNASATRERLCMRYTNVIFFLARASAACRANRKTKVIRFLCVCTRACAVCFVLCVLCRRDFVDLVYVCVCVYVWF